MIKIDKDKAIFKKPNGELGLPSSKNISEIDGECSVIRSGQALRGFYPAGKMVSTQDCGSCRAGSIPASRPITLKNNKGVD